MGTMNVGSAIGPAINHTMRVLFRPFALRKWLALGFVSLLVEIGQGGAHFNGSGDSHGSDATGRTVGLWVTEHVALIIAGVVLLVLIGIVMSWLSSVLRFVYLNQITRDPCAIREPFRRYIGIGTSFFLWRLALGFAMLLALGLLVGLPIGLVFLGHMTGNTLVVVLLVIWCVIVGVGVLFSGTLLDLCLRDFVATAMFVRGVRAMEGWRIVLPILKANRGQSALYVLLVIAFAIGIGLAALFVMLAVGMVFLIVGGLFALIGYGIYCASGQTWSPALIGYSIVMGSVLFAAFCYAMSCATQPFEVFRRSFALAVLGQAEPSLATIPVD